MTEPDGEREGDRPPVNVQVDREMLKDTLRELLNEMPGLRTLAAAGPSGEPTVGTTATSAALTSTPSASGEFRGR